MFPDVLEIYGDALDEYAYFMDRDHVRGAVPVADVRKCPEIRNPGFADICGHFRTRQLSFQSLLGKSVLYKF